MPDNMERVGVMAEVAMAAAAVTYPLVKVISGYFERRQQREAKRFGAAAAVVEARLIERCAGLEARLTQLEQMT